MPRLTDPDPASWPEENRALLSTLPPDPMVKALSHSVGTVVPFIQLARAQFTSLALSSRSREMVILAVAASTESSFVWAQHEPMAEHAGVEEATRDLIRERRYDDAQLSPADRALLRFAAEVLQGPHVPDEIFDEARTFLTERELVEVLQVIGYYWSFGRVSTVLEIEVTKVYGDEPVLRSDEASPR
ncbi:hypothetical protein ABZ614_41795 [Streptomyces sp. NPDC013178]|uniref:carboxymuconolactone decarboxylase family protein n=1 Tax=Streptomyces sp. NPDC013178 TaxID=3155118 RepID=UPI0033EF2312